MELSWQIGDAITKNLEKKTKASLSKLASLSLEQEDTAQCMLPIFCIDLHF